jgi:hypothetical protein
MSLNDPTLNLVIDYEFKIAHWRMRRDSKAKLHSPTKTEKSIMTALSNMFGNSEGRKLEGDMSVLVKAAVAYLCTENLRGNGVDEYTEED